MIQENPAFEEYYRNLYGPRWDGLRESLLEGAPPVWYSHGLIRPYVMDNASILAAASLPLPESGIILDACAAPGGKSLVIASRMPPGAELLSNEPSRERRRRLLSSLDECLDEEKRSRVRVSGFDAARLGARKTEHGRFAAVLLDVPCSSEAHVLQSPEHLAKWTAARPKFLASRQWAILSAGFLILQSGGSLVYSTCAISEEENDGVAGRLIKKYGSQATLEEPDLEGAGEQTKYGRIILPDKAGGIGPMYVARFRKGSNFRLSF